MSLFFLLPLLHGNVPTNAELNKDGCSLNLFQVTIHNYWEGLCRERKSSHLPKLCPAAMQFPGYPVPTTTTQLINTQSVSNSNCQQLSLDHRILLLPSLAQNYPLSYAWWSTYLSICSSSGPSPQSSL